MSQDMHRGGWVADHTVTRSFWVKNPKLTQLQELGLRLLDSRWFRIKAAWYSFMDTNVATQTKIHPKPCCDQVPRLK